MTRSRGGRARGGALAAAVALVLAACTPGDGAAGPPRDPDRTVPDRSTSPPVTLSPEPACPKARVWLHDRTLFGTHVSTSTLSYEEAFATLDATFGRMPAVRMFDPGPPPATAWERRAPLVQGRRVVHSFRIPPAEVLSGAWDDHMRGYFAGVPADIDLFWTYYHEVEPVIEAGAFTAAEFRRAFRHLVDLAQEVCRPNTYPTLILTGYTAASESGRDWRPYYPGDDYVSVLGWDPYNSASRRPTEYAPPEEVFGHVVAVSEDAGKPFGIAETGSRLVRGDDGAQRARWLDEIARYLVEQEAVFVTYYQSVGVSGADYRLRDPAGVRAWRRWVSAP